MDQLKDIVRTIVAQRFWVLSGLVFVVGLVCWYFAVSGLQYEADEQIKKLNAAHSDASNIQSVRNHPNQFSLNEMIKVKSETERSVNAAWEKKYEAQVNVLIWPARLEDDFAIAVKSKRSAELLEFPTPAEKEISVLLRERYRNYMKEVLPKLTEPIKAEWRPGALQNAGFAPVAALDGGPGGKPPEEDKFVVEWNAANQAKIAARFDWSKQVQNVPTTLQILYAQEDFWVLESIMSIIAQTNGDVTARYKAAIKTIESIDLGVDAQQTTGKIYRVPFVAAAGADPNAGGVPNPAAPQAPPPVPEQGRGPGQGLLPGGAPGGAMTDPAENRYVDNNLKPITGSVLRQSLTSEDLTLQFLKAAKRMPVRLRLSMDIRKLNRLLIECGNSKLPLEVRQVRINRGEGAQIGMGLGGGGGGGGPGMNPGDRMPNRDLAMRAGQPGMDAIGGAARANIVDPFLTPVEIYGLVYIYNPPPAKPAAPVNPVPPVNTTGAKPATANTTGGNS